MYSLKKDLHFIWPANFQSDASPVSFYSKLLLVNGGSSSFHFFVTYQKLSYLSFPVGGYDINDCLLESLTNRQKVPREFQFNKIVANSTFNWYDMFNWGEVHFFILPLTTIIFLHSFSLFFLFIVICKLTTYLPSFLEFFWCVLAIRKDPTNIHYNL